jgi:hypothetical protein
MLRDNKVYGVYEMTRDVQGNMVTRWQKTNALKD